MTSTSDRRSPVRPDFHQIVSTFGLQALMACGKVLHPVSRKFEVDLPMADYHIGVLELLKEKTTGNLTEAEKNHLDDMLYQARMAYVDACSRPPSAAQAESPGAATERTSGEPSST